MTNSRFSFRALTSLILFWMFLALTVSGVILFIAPPGRIAHWSEWRLLLLTKGQWQGVHTLSSLVFLIGGLFHLLKFNRHVIWTYVKRSRQAAAPFRGVVASSVAIAALVFAGTVAGWPPFSLVVQLGERATRSWEGPENSPPSPHAEELTLTAIIDDLDLDLESARTILAEVGIEVSDPDEKLRHLAAVHERTPAELYELLSEGARRPAESADKNRHSPGLGRRTLAEVVSEKNIPIETALRRLREAGYVADRHESLRDIARRNDLRPIDVLEIVTDARQP